MKLYIINEKQKVDEVMAYLLNDLIIICMRKENLEQYKLHI